MDIWKKWIIEQVQDGVFYAGSKGAHGTVWTSRREDATRYYKQDAWNVSTLVSAYHDVAVMVVRE